MKIFTSTFLVTFILAILILIAGILFIKPARIGEHVAQIQESVSREMPGPKISYQIPKPEESYMQDIDIGKLQQSGFSRSGHALKVSDILEYKVPTPEETNESIARQAEAREAYEKYLVDYRTKRLKKQKGPAAKPKEIAVQTNQTSMRPAGSNAQANTSNIGLFYR